MIIATRDKRQHHTRALLEPILDRVAPPFPFLSPAGLPDWADFRQLGQLGPLLRGKKVSWRFSAIWAHLSTNSRIFGRICEDTRF